LAEKEEDTDQALSELLMGQEVMCETTPSKIILGVVTTFDRWDFIRNEPEKIYRDEKNFIQYDVLQNNGNIKTINEEKSLRKCLNLEVKVDKDVEIKDEELNIN
jgi:hypothetical protein